MRFSEDDTILKDLVYFEEEAGVGAGTPLERVQRAVWGMFYADDAGVVSTSQDGLARMMTTIIHRGSVWGIWPDSVGEEGRDSLDAGAGETAEERGIAATTTWHRSSGAKVRPDRPVPIFGQRRWRTHAGDQPPDGAEQRGHASGGSPGSSSTGREHRGDLRFDY